MSATCPYTHLKSDHLLLENKAKRKHPAANLSTTRFFSLARNVSNDRTSWVVRTLACRFSFRLAFAVSLMFIALGVTAVPTWLMFRTFNKNWRPQWSWTMLMEMPPSLEGFPDNFPHLPSSKGKGLCWSDFWCTSGWNEWLSSLSSPPCYDFDLNHVWLSHGGTCVLISYMYMFYICVRDRLHVGSCLIPASCQCGRDRN